MSIEDMIANPVVSPMGQMIGQGIADRQTRRANNLEFLIKQFGYSEALKNVPLNDMKRDLEVGSTKFAKEHQQENLERGQDVKSLDEDMAISEQLVRGLNNPSTYAGYAEIYKDRLTPDFFDKEGAPLPFEATSRQRATMHKQALDSIPHERDIDKARIMAGMKTNGYTATSPTNFQAEAAHDRISKLISDNGLMIGSLKGKDPSDAKLAKRALAEQTAQIAKKIADSGGIPNESEISEKLVSFMLESKKENPTNKDAPFYKKWAYDDEMIDWNVYNPKVNQEYGINSNYSSPISAFISGPARVFKDMSEVESAAKKAEKEGKPWKTGTEITVNGRKAVWE